MQVHFEYFAKRLMALFLYYNEDCFESNKVTDSKEKKFHFLNFSQETWNSEFKQDIATYQKSLDNMDAVIQQENHLCLFFPEIVTLKSS